MKEELTEREALLIELVHSLAFGSESELGLTLDEVMLFLNAKVKGNEKLTVLEILETDGRSFLDQLFAQK